MLTSKQEKFAQLLGTSTISQSDAYRQAYDASGMADETIHNSAYKVANDDEVAARIRQLRNETKEHLKYDAEAHFKELEASRLRALEGKKQDLGIELKALELKGKLVGLYVDKAETEFKGGGYKVVIETKGTRVNEAPTNNT